MDRGRIGRLMAAGVMVLALTGCGFHPLAPLGHGHGFLVGILHGLIAPLSLVAGIFLDIRIYSQNHVGWWYDLGFLLGLVPWTRLPALFEQK